MATASTAPNNTPPLGDAATLEASWALTTADPTGQGVCVAGYRSLCWHGTTSAAGGATMAFEGSNDGSNWFALTKVGGSTAATLTAAGGAQTNELPKFVRPNLTTVGAAAVWTARLLASK